MVESRHSSAIVEFQQKRDSDSVAFLCRS